jgi:peptidoglycan/LPS O-acetylase OafA/YrhL
MSANKDSNLDFLRGFAVLLVVFAHLGEFFDFHRFGPWLLGGFAGTLGVMIFFVHTSCVLMMSLERQYAANRRKLFASFMIRRCFRIYPLSMLSVGIVAAFHIPQAIISGHHFVGWRFDGGDVFSNLFLVQNFSFRVSILGPIWSLSYELQMYLFLPLLFLAIRGSQSIWRALAIGTLALAVSVIALHYSTTPNLALYVPCFMPGILAYQLQRKNRACIPAWLWAVSVPVMAAIYLLGPTQRVRVWATCLVLGLCIPFFRQLTSHWMTVPSALIARYSYGVYLTHYTLIWLVFERFGFLPTIAKWAIFPSLLTALSVSLYHFIELPLTNMGRNISERYAAGTGTQVRPAALLSRVKET